MKKRSTKHDTFAMSVMYDTLLFLCFVSLSGVIVLPMFYQESAYVLSQHQAHEGKVDTTLQMLLTSTVDEFSYTTAGSLIDGVGETIGINTSQKDGVYELLTNWFLGKEQLHKTYAQIISENLVTQFNIPLSENETVSLNIFTNDFTGETISMLEDFLDTKLSERYHYNLTAHWHPIITVPFGGNIEIGDSLPVTNLYQATQKIFVPFVPVFYIDSQPFVFSKQGIKNHISDMIYENNSITGNISNLLHSNYLRDTANDINTTLIDLVAENLTDLARGLLTTGIDTGTNGSRIPGLLDLILTFFISSILEKAENLTKDLDFSLESINSIFTTLNTSSSIDIFSEIEGELTGLISSSISDVFNNMTDAVDQLIDHVCNYVSMSLDQMIYPTMINCAEKLIEMYSQTNDFLESILDIIFDQLSLSTATISLTIWEKSI